MRQLWWQRVQALPMPEVEESILFRMLTQALVSVGIIATDIAADTTFSLWAVPLSLLGATWSWMRRCERNIPTKFLLAIAMLVALAAFFVRMIGGRELNDTRLVLAELLIQLQVLHSFDMPRRKDLGYSMVIGIILIGVASTLSQTMAFGGMLVVFLAIALPVLVMDYRSRLGLTQSGQPKLRLRKVNFAALPLTFLLTLALGLAVFAVMPRFSGYQLRSFPMSSQIAPQGNFDNRRVNNPGYVRSGKEGAGRGSGQSDNGQMDEDVYYGFNDRINQNLRGQLKPRVVMRVRSQAEGFWRVLAFDRYTGQGWELSRNNDTRTVKRPSWSYQFYLPQIFNRSRKKEVVQTYTMVTELPNLIPAMAQPRELYFPTQEMAIDAEGGLRSPVGLREGLTYTVISEVPYRNRTLLQKVAIDAVPDGSLYLQVPEKSSEKIRKRTEELLATSPQPITATYEKALFLAQALKQRYTIQTEIPPLSKDQDLVDAFLFRFKGGYPDHFSSALTVMLRSIGIPARLVAGFAPGQFNPFTGLYEVKNTDAYAMTEVYFPNYGWFAFDPIPGHELVPPSIEEDQTFTVLQTFWKWVAGWLPSPVSSVLSRVFGAIVQWLGGILSWIVSLFFRGWIGLFSGLIALTGLSFLGWLSWQGWQKWRYRRRLSKLPPMERLYQQMLSWLAQKGFRKHPAQTALEYARQSHTVQTNYAQTIQDISQAYVSWRYGGQTPDLRSLQQQFREMRKTKIKGER